MAALFFDIDGTLVEETTQNISESTMQSLKKAKQGGHLLFINTGRTACDIPKELEEVPFDGYCCGCGTYIRYRDQVLFHSKISSERGAEIVSYMKERGIEGALEGTEDIYFQEETYENPGMEEFRTYVRQRGNGIKHRLDEPGMRYDKFSFSTDDAAVLEKFTEFLVSDIRVIDYGTGIYECIQKAYSKGTAIAWLQEYLNLDEEEIYVFGDSANDIDMFACMKHTIAMGRHDKVLEPWAEYVTDNIERDGIQKALEHYGLI